MNTTTLLILGVATALVVILGVKVRFYLKEGQQLQTSGFVPRWPTLFARYFIRLISPIAAFIAIGKVKVIGRENLRHLKGSVAVTGNHQYPLDFICVYTALRFYCRHLAVADQVTGIKGALAAWAGFFAVQGGAGHAKSKDAADATIEAFAKSLTENERARLLAYMQGKLVTDNVLRPEDFRTGLIRGMQLARTRLNERGQSKKPLMLLPTATHYPNAVYPPVGKCEDCQARRTKGRCQKPTCERSANMKPGWRRVWGITNNGATVAIGEPIMFEDLPADPREATEFVRLKIDALLTQAKQAS